MMRDVERMEREAEQLVVGLFGEGARADYGASMLILELVAGLENNVLLMGLAATIIQVISTRTGFSKEAVVQDIMEGFEAMERGDDDA